MGNTKGTGTGTGTDTGNHLSERVLEELRASTLKPDDLKVKVLTHAEKSATGAPFGAEGYVIPYFGLDGKPLPFYRVKIFDAPEVKYRQLADSQNHIYFPPKLTSLIEALDYDHDFRYILITEGEKKAAAAVRAGIPCCALSGVDSWKSRTLLLPKDSSLATKPNGMLSIKLPPGVPIKDGNDTLAVGFQDLVNLIIRRNIPIILAFDSDPIKFKGKANASANASAEIVTASKGEYRFEVARAASQFGFELRHKGVKHANIRYIVPCTNTEGKVGLDDLLAQPGGPVKLVSQIQECLAKRNCFPLHPNIREYINRKLTRTQMQRSEQMSVAMAILADLDARGQRLRSPDEEAMYYFSHQDKSLTKVSFSFQPEHADSPFGRYLYRNYNLGFTDNKVMSWLASMFSGEEPIENVYPEKVLAWRKDVLYYQISSSTMAKVSKDGIVLIDNGTDNVLFESDIIKDTDIKDMRLALFAAQQQKKQVNWWYDVLKDARIRDTEDDKQRRLLSLLYYVSPMFYRWRGTQLPVEITTGEAGSGKSTLYSLRLSILTGDAKLRNPPNDLKDWNASLASSGGLHVTDNVQFTNAELRQRLSDEICRLVTEAKPSIEQRKLYSDTATIKIPVRVVFGITAIKQPFTNIDILQRSIVTELDKGINVDLKYDADWESHQLSKRGGRAMWLAHQLVFVQRLLQEIDQNWQDRFQAGYRLINLEQLLILSAKTLGWDSSWIPNYLESGRDSKMANADWALEGIIAFAEYVRLKWPSSYDGREITAQQMSEWLSSHEQFTGCSVLAQPRSLIRYLHANKHTVASMAYIIPAEVSTDGRMCYYVKPKNNSKTSEPMLPFSGTGELIMNLSQVVPTNFED